MIRVTVASLGLLTILSAGCSTPVVSDYEMRAPAAGKVLSATLLAPAADTFPVIVKRDREYMLFSCATRLYVDGSPVVDLGPGEGLILHLPPGKHSLAAEICPGLGGGGVAEYIAQIGPSGDSKFRIKTFDGSDPSIQPSAF